MRGKLKRLDSWVDLLPSFLTARIPTVQNMRRDILPFPGLHPLRWKFVIELPGQKTVLYHGKPNKARGKEVLNAVAQLTKLHEAAPRKQRKQVLGSLLSPTPLKTPIASVRVLIFDRMGAVLRYCYEYDESPMSSASRRATLQWETARVNSYFLAMHITGGLASLEELMVNPVCLKTFRFPRGGKFRAYSPVPKLTAVQVAAYKKYLTRDLGLFESISRAEMQDVPKKKKVSPAEENRNSVLEALTGRIVTGITGASMRGTCGRCGNRVETFIAQRMALQYYRLIQRGELRARTVVNCPTCAMQGIRNVVEVIFYYEGVVYA